MKKIVAFILTVVLLLLSVVPVFAEEKETFISDVALVYENSVEDAKKAIEGTDWKLYEKDLNPKADLWFDDGVYLIYKTTTNVEEAITDLRVMDMYGGYSMSNYEEQLKKSREGYEVIIEYVKICVAEFKKLYDAGDEMARLAYRQMNFYKDVKVSDTSDETDLLMGDFFLSDPSDEEYLQVLMEGNTFVIANLIKLLALGVSGIGENTLSAKLEKIYSGEVDYDTQDIVKKADALKTAFDKVRENILRYDAIEDEYDFEKDELTEEDYNFAINFASVALICEQIMLGDSNLADFLRKGEYTEKDLYPIAAAFTDAQIALAEMGQIDAILEAHSPSKPMEELEELVAAAEDELKNENGEIVAVDVYFGVDRSMYDGSFAVTNAAERQQALTGETWNFEDAQKSSKAFYIAGVAVMSTGVTVAAVSKIMIKVAASIAKNLASKYGTMALAPNYIQYFLRFCAKKLAPAMPYIYTIAAGSILVAIGLAGISTVYSYYNTKYVDIPNAMIDVKETDLGDRYVKYTAAKCLGDDNKNADFNAYQGKEWIALYYTKDASAGKCLTPNFKYSSSSSKIERRYQGVSMFGETDAFNLNSHVYSAKAPSVFLSVRYSNTQKAAATLPEVVGSMYVQGGIFALCAFGGVGVGIGGTVLVGYLINKRSSGKVNKEEKEAVSSEN